MGEYPLVGAATVTVMVILWVFPTFEKRIDQFQEDRNYEFTSSLQHDKRRQLELLLREYHLERRSQKRVSEATS